MEFGSLKLDLNALAALITALGGIIMVVKGAKQRQKKKGDKDAD